ncbi:MAG: argininosuccinate lyase [Candidatus Magnetoovum sp. WYHC-5]|nr:argininosuccinate lyase [Candidatus Magnetoovum sp. WYHC-5]
MKKLWSGRFSEPVSKIVEGFTESISFDFRLWPYDIEGSIAHATMLARQGLITDSDKESIINGLLAIAEDIENGKFTFSKEDEDVHMNIENALSKRIGDAGRKLHTARSRNDQVALDVRLYLRKEITDILKLIQDFRHRLVTIAEQNLTTVMPGYTHMQIAQPVTLAHHLMAYVEMFGRDRQRLEDTLRRVNVMPLGACALSGTSLNIDRLYVAELLGFEAVTQNSMDSVSDRDFIVEFIANSSILFMHLSRMAEDFILWFTKEFAFVDYSDSCTTGSSIMPQKKNPDVLELMRGKTGRIYGCLINILTVMKALPLSYNRDMQEDKPSLFDAVDTVKHTLITINEFFKNIEFKKERLYNASFDNFSMATDVAEYLVKKGMPFRIAHETVGKIVRFCIENDKRLETLSLSQYVSFCDLIEDDIFDILKPEYSVNSKKSIGGTAPEETKKLIEKLKKTELYENNT